MSSDDTQSFPRKPRASLRIGVTGHRSEKLADADLAAVSACMDTFLGEIEGLVAKECLAASALFASSSPELVAVSALASGADQIFAAAAIRRRWLLDAVLPFPRDEYVKDFALEPKALEGFNALVQEARAVFALDGQRASDPTAVNRAYEAAGLVMLAKIDLLCAVWHGKPAEGVGGTALIVASAVEDGIPVILIDPSGKAPAKILWSGLSKLSLARSRLEEMDQLEAQNALPQVITALLAAPPDISERKKLEQYFAEPQRRVVPSMSFSLLLRVLTRKPMRRDELLHPEYLAKTREEWAGFLKDIPRSGLLGERISTSLLPAYAFADKLAVAYAQLYRGAFTFNFLAAFLTVALASLGLFAIPPSLKPYFGIVELILIVMIAWRTYRANSARWHSRWLDYRRLAEELRIMRLASLVGAAWPARRPTRGDDAESWIGWLVRAYSRELPLPGAEVNSDYLSKILQSARAAEIAGQIEFHKANSKRMHTVEERLHLLGLSCFILTAVIVGIGLPVRFHALPLTGEVEHTTSNWVTFLTVLLPMLGAMLYAIRVQGDFASIVERSERTVRALEAVDAVLKSEVEMTQGLTLARLSDRLEKAADAIGSDLDQWQILSTAKPISLPA